MTRFEDTAGVIEGIGMDVQVVSGRRRAGDLVIQLRGVNRDVMTGNQAIFSLVTVPPATLRVVLLAPESTAASALISS